MKDISANKQRHSSRRPAWMMLHGRVVRPPDMGATLASVAASSVRGVPGFVDLVVRESFVGVVARTQFAAMVAAEQLKVHWKPGPALPPRDTFFEFLRRQPSRDQIAIDSSDVDAALGRAGGSDGLEARLARAGWDFAPRSPVSRSEHRADRACGHRGIMQFGSCG